ncbi:phage portal protein [Weissella viridescens]|uniref:Phage portal protein n=2 Tax=Weissella viridescens TaxID=1629 RepID=A0A3P2RL64_WEIVI|nr:phage portal protein [Weissella viridescens]
MGNYLKTITDHPDINLPTSEILRIQEDLRYYRNDMKKVSYYNTYNQKKERKPHTLALTKQMSRQLASLVFNEGMTISIQPHVDEKETANTQENDELDQFIKKVLADNNFNQNYEENLELGIATGGFAVRPYIENGAIKLAWIGADQFVPLDSNTNEITSAAIVNKRTVSERDTTVWYSLLEFHYYDEVARTETIENEVYRSETANEIGQNVPLSNWDKSLPEKVVLSGLSRPTFAYFKMPGKNNFAVESPLGVGISENAKSIIDAANIAYDQFVREVQLAKRRVFVPSSMIRPTAKQEGNLFDDGFPKFDEDEDVFMQFKDKEGANITQVDTTIRNVQYTATLQYHLHALENNVGLSQGTLTTDGAINDKTATEVVSDNSATYRTRSSIITQCEKQLYGLIRSILELANLPLFEGKTLLNYDIQKNPIDINLHFEDGVFVDKDAQAKQDMLIVQQGMMPKVEFLQRNYGLSEEDAKRWIQEAQDDVANNDPLPKEQKGMFGDGGGDE